MARENKNDETQLNEADHGIPAQGPKSGSTKEQNNPSSKLAKQGTRK